MTDRLELPYFPLWVDDWLASPAINAMSAEQEGAYIRLLVLAWRGDPPCTLPDDDRALASMSRLGSRWKKLGPSVRQQFTLIDGRLRNAKLFSVYEESVARHARQVAKGKLGGRPAKPEDKPEITSAFPQLKPDESPGKAEGKPSVTNREGEGEGEKARSKAKAKPPAADAARVSAPWLQVIAAEWDAKNGAGSFPYGLGGKALKPLTAHHTPETIAQHLGAYLAQTESRFVNLHRFAQTFAQWGPGAIGNGPSSGRRNAGEEGYENALIALQGLEAP